MGVPRSDGVLQQHARYWEALGECGLTITTLDADVDYPDSTFVEDTAVLTARSATLTRPGARSRRGEVAAMRQTISSFFPSTLEIEAPGTLDGGDICEAENHFFLGLSHRTNEVGVRQLAAHLGRQGYTSSVIDVRGMSSILHLKSGISYIGNNTLVVIEGMAGNPLFQSYERVRVAVDETMPPTAFASMNVYWLQPGIRTSQRNSPVVDSVRWRWRCQSFRRWTVASAAFPCGSNPVSVGSSAGESSENHCTGDGFFQEKWRPMIPLTIRWSVAAVGPTPTPKLISHLGETFRSVTKNICCCCIRRESNAPSRP